MLGTKRLTEALRAVAGVFHADISTARTSGWVHAGEAGEVFAVLNSDAAEGNELTVRIRKATSADGDNAATAVEESLTPADADPATVLASVRTDALGTHGGGDRFEWVAVQIEAGSAVGASGTLMFASLRYAP